MLGDLQNESGLASGNVQSVQDLGKSIFKLKEENCKNGWNNVIKRNPKSDQDMKNINSTRKFIIIQHY
jgi:hypothetical protein